MSLEENVALGKEVKELLEMIGEKPAHYWHVLRTAADERIPKDASAAVQDPMAPLSEKNAITFEREKAPYGKYEGFEVGLIPPWYLVFLSEGDEFSKKVRRYVKTPMFQQRLRDEP